MKERPILFNGAMVKALLAGTKTQTRREFKAKNGNIWPNDNDRPGMLQILRNCPYGQPGDKLWVKEAWTTHAFLDKVPPRDLTTLSIHYLADGEIKTGKYRPSLFMPRWASRILLEVVSIRVERLSDISDEDAIAEGLLFNTENAGNWSGTGDRWFIAPHQAYRHLWASINGPDSWTANPWVWVVEFRQVKA